MLEEMFWSLFIILSIRVIISSALENRRRLNDGNMMPPIAFGTFGKLHDELNIGPHIVFAIEAGYRHFDTSPIYNTEEEIGRAIVNVTSRGIVTRNELFITTKLDDLSNCSAVVPALQQSLARLQLNYVDLYLIHLSHSEITGKEVNYMDIWKGMEAAKMLGLTKSIGVSNFNSTHINKILANYTIRPAVNQIEVNPTYTQLDLVAYCQTHGINVMSYGPFGFLVPRPFRSISPPPKFNDTLLVKIAKKYRKNTSQVVLRYLLDRGTIPIPRSVNQTHILSNINIFDFSLLRKEVYAINEFNLDSKVYTYHGGQEGANILYEYYYGTTVDKLQITLGTSNRKILLNDGHKMPPIAFGTFGKISEVETIAPAVVFAIEAGFRHIDTAPIYFNEVQIGEAIMNVTSRGIVKRSDLFITTKLDRLSDKKAVWPALKQSLKRLQLDYVDLYLIHSPLNLLTGKEFDYLDIWKGMEDVQFRGLAKSIGVSNFNSSQINEILAKSRIRPAVNQVEVNPTFTNLDLVAYCRSESIHVMSYSPFGFLVPRPYKNFTLPPKFDDPTLVRIAKKYGKKSSEIVLRYLIDRGTIPIPKSTNREHIKSNLNVFDFSLTRKEIYTINKFDLNIPLYGFKELDDLYKYIFGTTEKEIMGIVNTI